ncbi:uncharacterized protein LOC126814327 isoform X1 [Patella vulgata]|uniref:uncharacterized protein LOC126814327 isoform X1 n=1 Tax=Patella vulgata TaxID=6465 RepID=UPI00217F4102|nr:uncharacterized protein LOC126814327 isoform X1 [Patella vulgata]XP_050395374.1 uncharacterized protein LOC126814327 isoform X1 [Patella vulgata]XP_050395376.1 uncharacterized protein LOC126814327 isoform X1 [Patella vulgata]
MAESKKPSCCILVLCGLPGSGKSSLCHYLHSWQQESEQYLPVLIEYDQLMPPDLETDLIENQSNKNNSWKSYREQIVKCIEYLILKTNTHNTIDFTLDGIDHRLLEKFKDIIDKQIINLNRNNVKVTKKQIDHSSEEEVTDDDCCEFNPDSKHDALMTHQGSSDYDVANPYSQIMNNAFEKVDLDNTSVVIIIDDNMYYRSMRYDYYQLARNYSLGFCQIYVECPLEIALERNSKRKNGIVNPLVITKMSEKFQIPDATNSWERYSLQYSANLQELSRSKFMDFIHFVKSNPVAPQEETDPEIIAESQRLTSANMIHQADLIIRQLISEQMVQAKRNGATKDDLKNLSSKLADVKIQITKSLKQDGIILKDEQLIIDAAKDINSELYQIITQIFNDSIS